jgi:hypothetical protein
VSRTKIAISALVLAGALLYAQGSPPAAPLVLLSRDGRRPLPTTLINSQELIALDDLTGLFQVTVREDALAGGVTVTYKGRTIVVSAAQATASVAGRLVALPSPPVRSGRRFLVPVEFLSRALAPIYDSRIDLRKASRLVIVGDLRVPRVTPRVEQTSSGTRLTLEVSPSAAVAVTPDSARVLVHIEADALDVTLPVPGGGLVDQIRQGDQPTTIAVTLRPGAGTARAVTVAADTGTRVTIDIPSAAAAATPPAQTPGAQPPAPGTPAPPAAGEAPPLAAPRAAVQAIVIDPGHGGDDNGVKGVGNVLEKTAHARRGAPAQGDDRNAARRARDPDSRRGPQGGCR